MPELDADLNRKAAGNIRQYIKQDLKDEKEMFVWVWKELMNKCGKSLTKKLFWVVLFGYVLSVIKPWALGLVFTGLASEVFRGDLVVWGLVLCTTVTIIGHFVNRKGLLYRELLFGENARQLDKKTTELFFEKSLGMHIDESSLLSEANIRNGYDRVFRMTGIIVWEGTETVFGLVLPFVALWFLNWPSAALLTVVFIAHLLWSLFLNQRVMRDGLPIDKDFRAMNRFRLERLSQIERVKNNSKEKDELDELGRKFENVIRPDRKLWLWHVEQIILRGFVTYLALVAIMVYGVYMVWYSQMVIGLLYPLFTWASQLADNFWRVGNLEREINFLTPSVLSMKEALTMPVGLETIEKPKVLSSAITEMDFRNVGHVYKRQKDRDDDKGGLLSVLKDVSFAVAKGEKIAVIGPSGVGKTTIVRLVLRYMDPTAGDILVNGISLRELSLSSYLSRVGYMPQDSQIFDGTIRYNLLYGLPELDRAKVSDAELWELMKLLRIDFGERLTHGLDTLVGRNGIKLSGGQAQRVMLGAAVIKKPSLMVIDEATSSLDATTEKLVQEGLEQVLTKDMCALIITHRLNTIRRICNKFIMLSGNGEGSMIIGQAYSFEELASVCPEFRSLALDQGIVL